MNMFVYRANHAGGQAVDPNFIGPRTPFFAPDPVAGAPAAQPDMPGSNDKPIRHLKTDNRQPYGANGHARPNARCPANIGGYPLAPVISAPMSCTLIAGPTTLPGTRSHRALNRGCPGDVPNRRTGATNDPRSCKSSRLALGAVARMSEGHPFAPHGS